MPVYQFRCPDCAATFDEKRPFARADDPATCPGCGGRRSAKVFAAAMVFSPGSAAKALLEPKAATKGAPPKADHGVGCPCCAGRAR